MQWFLLNEECAVNTGCPNSGCGAIVHVLQPPYSLFPLAIVGALIVVHVNVLGACVSCRVISYRHNYHHYSTCTCNYANAKANQLETGAGVTIKALGEHLLHPLGHEPHTCIFGKTRFVDCHHAVHVQRSRAPSAAARSITKIRYVFSGVSKSTLQFLQT